MKRKNPLLPIFGTLVTAFVFVLFGVMYWQGIRLNANRPLTTLDPKGPFSLSIQDLVVPVFLVVVRRQNDDACLFFRHYLPCRFQAVHYWHIDIHRNEVRLLPSNKFDGFRTVHRLPHNDQSGYGQRFTQLELGDALVLDGNNTLTGKERIR